MLSSTLKLHTEYTGSEFLHDNLTHYGFKYGLGLNSDTKQFKPFGECSDGGLYFCEENKRHLYYRNYGFNLALIEIPDDARVYVEENKFKADKLFIKNIADFRHDDNFWIDMAIKDGDALKHVINQTEEICILVVKQDYRALQYVKNQTPLMCKLAIEQKGCVLQYVN